ncbi:hypothetical protein [uncultured Brevibacillus sp.]|nr:hypothetical protein [uncultured Brevibacillus sp.]
MYHLRASMTVEEAVAHFQQHADEYGKDWMRGEKEKLFTANEKGDKAA